MSVKKVCQLGDLFFTAFASFLLLFFFSPALAQAPSKTPQPLSDSDLQSLCSIGSDANTGIRYVDNLVSLIYENQGDQFSLSTFSPFGPDSTDNLGHNIYAGAYLKVAKEPLQNAINRTAAATGLSGQEVQAVMNGAVDVLRSRRKNLTYEEAIQEAENLKSLYNEQIKLTQLETEIRGFTTPLEIFTDGDVVNSGGFDLLTDLDRIDYLLFYNQAQVSKGADLDFLSSPSPSPNLNPTSSPSSVAVPFASPTPTATPSSALNSTGSNSGNNQPLPSSSPSAYIPNTLASPLQCFADSNLNSEINNALSKPLQQNEAEKNQEEFEQDLNQKVTSALANGEEITYPVGPTLTPEKTDQEEKTLDQKNREATCNDWVCFEVIFNVKQQSLFTDRANCVACHVEKAKESLDATVSKNLVPNKLTGNLMEAAKCKNASANVGFPINVITVFNPVKTPPNTNNVGTEFLVSYDKLLEKVMGGDYYDPKLNQFVSKIAQIQSQVIKSVPPNTSADETERQVRAAVTKAQDEAARAVKNTLGESIAFNKGDFYQQVSKQLILMDAYFKAMTMSFQDINNNICPQIQNKPACS